MGSNDTERLPPHKALLAILFINLLLWSGGYAIVQAWIAVYRMARSLLP